jgi:hypothetical protein
VRRELADESGCVLPAVRCLLFRERCLPFKELCDLVASRLLPECSISMSTASSAGNHTRRQGRRTPERIFGVIAAECSSTPVAPRLHSGPVGAAGLFRSADTRPRVRAVGEPAGRHQRVPSGARTQYWPRCPAVRRSASSSEALPRQAGSVHAPSRSSRPTARAALRERRVLSRGSRTPSHYQR